MDLDKVTIKHNNGSIALSKKADLIPGGYATETAYGTEDTPIHSVTLATKEPIADIVYGRMYTISINDDVLEGLYLANKQQVTTTEMEEKEMVRIADKQVIVEEIYKYYFVSRKLLDAVFASRASSIVAPVHGNLKGHR